MRLLRDSMRLWQHSSSPARASSHGIAASVALLAYVAPANAVDPVDTSALQSTPPEAPQHSADHENALRGTTHSPPGGISLEPQELNQLGVHSLHELGQVVPGLHIGGGSNRAEPAYTILNLGVGWQSPEGRLALRAFVNNALNTAYATLVSSSATNHQRWYNEPRLAGVRMMLTW